MITFGYHCPHCRTQNVAFTVTGFADYALANSRSSSVMANCNRCKQGIIANLNIGVDTARSIRNRIEQQSSYDLGAMLSLGSVKFYPQPPQIEIPAHLPNDVAEELKTAEQLFVLNGLENNFIKPAGNAYRSVLEKALCHLADNSERARLNKRIEKLFDDGKLTKDLKNFAMHIRTLSADASHAYHDFSIEELNELRLFINLFLQYTFTLPAMIPDESRGDVVSNG